MDPASEERDVVCRLERRDGSVWRVTGLDLEDGTPTVSAVRNDPVGDPDAVAARLRRQPLARGDRLVWLDRSGEVVWALRSPWTKEGRA